MKQTLLILLCALGIGAEQQKPRPIEVWPVDEALSDHDLLTTRTAVMDALKRRDIERLVALMGDDMYRPGQGSATLEERKAGLRRRLDWDLNNDRPRQSDLLLTALSLGGSFTTKRGSVQGERQFCAPYVYSAFPNELPERPSDDGAGGPPDLDLPWFSSLLIAKNIPVRRRPGVQAPVIGYANYSLVIVDTVEGDRDPAGVLWEHITTTDAIDGYVPKNVVRSPFDHYMCFGQRQGQWKITEFGEGRDPSLPF